MRCGGSTVVQKKKKCQVHVIGTTYYVYLYIYIYISTCYIYMYSVYILTALHSTHYTHTYTHIACLCDWTTSGVGIREKIKIIIIIKKKIFLFLLIFRKTPGICATACYTPPIPPPCRIPRQPPRIVMSRAGCSRWRLSSRSTGRCAHGGGSVHRKMLDWSTGPRRTTIDSRL